MIATGALAAVAALAPATSAAAHPAVALSTVKAYTDRAEYGLDRAVSAFERNADRRGSRELARSRRELGRATAEAAKLRRTARSERGRSSAARAQALVADQQEENVEQLVGVLDEVSGRVENTVAKAAIADTRGRDKAIVIIRALLERGVSDKAETGLLRRSPRSRPIASVRSSRRQRRSSETMSGALASGPSPGPSRRTSRARRMPPRSSRS